MHETAITREGLERLTGELERLTTEGRREIAERLQRAASAEPNRVENADYLDTLEDQALLERRIAVLEERLRWAEVVEPQPENDVVDVGERVRVRDLDSGDELELELVGPLESNASAGRLSVVSPLGQALVGRRRGEIATVEAPGGRRRFEILAVDAPTPAS